MSCKITVLHFCIRTGAAIALLLAVVFFVSAQERETIPAALSNSEVERILEDLRAEHSVPGFAVVISDRNGVIGSGAVGIKRAGDNDSVETMNRFHIGSISKPITSSAMGALVEAGILGWDSRVLDVLPEYRETSRPEYAGITLRQLLSHTAGIQPFEEDEEFEQAPDLNGDARERRRQFAKWVLTQQPVTVPGKGHVYSNAGYAVAAAMAEQASNEPFELMVQRTVFDPLKLKSAGIGAPAAKGMDEPWGHSRINEKWVPHGPEESYPFADIIRPAGDFHMNLFDLAEFGRAHMLGMEGANGFLRSATIRVIHTEVMDGYGLGWNVREKYDSHLGGLEGMHTALLMIMKQDGRVYALAVNAEMEDTAIFGKAISQLRRLP